MQTTIRIEWDNGEEITEQDPRAAAHAFRRVVRRRGFSPFLVEGLDAAGEVVWDFEWNDPDLWLQAEDGALMYRLQVPPVFVRLVFLNGPAYRPPKIGSREDLNFRSSENPNPNPQTHEK